MNWLRLLFILLLFPLLTAAKRPDYYARFNTDAFWQTLVQDAPDIAPRITTSDTVIVVASNRAPVPGQLRFLSEERLDDTVRYYIVYTGAGMWHVQHRTTLHAAIQALPQLNRDWVIYTEGMGKIFTTDLDRGLKLAGQYGVNVLLLDYPSIHSGYRSYQNYRFAYHNSCVAYQDFLPVLDSFKQLRRLGAAGHGSLSLFFHSMGNNVMRELVQHGRLAPYNDAVWVDNLVLNAPCVPRRHSTEWIEQIHFAKQVYVHYNPEDIVLKLARLAGFRQILGEHAEAPVAANAQFINFDRLCGNSHSNFLSLYARPPALPEALAHYGTLFHGAAIDVQDAAKYRRSAYNGIGWDILPAQASSRPSSDVERRHVTNR